MLLLIDIFSINRSRGYENPILEIIVIELFSTRGFPLSEHVVILISFQCYCGDYSICILMFCILFICLSEAINRREDLLSCYCIARFFINKTNFYSMQLCIDLQKKFQFCKYANHFLLSHSNRCSLDS
jgi:hypothetical protein